MSALIDLTGKQIGKWTVLKGNLDQDYFIRLCHLITDQSILMVKNNAKSTM